jgi:glyoxylase-like metal-dependent hydrolase (beta-lactamase superfamily II)
MPVHYEDEGVRIHKIVASPFDNNAYIIVCKATGNSLIIDTPRDVDKVLAEVGGTDVQAVAITHGHRDHIEGFEGFRSSLTAPIGLHQDDVPRLAPNLPDYLLQGGATMDIGELTLDLLHTPGHTAGGVCLLLGKHLFSGDTLFPGGPGKTQTPEALQQVIESITGTLFALPDDTAVYPGHGADTTIGDAKAEYAIFASRSHAPDLCGDVLWRGDN